MFHFFAIMFQDIKPEGDLSQTKIAHIQHGEPTTNKILKKLAENYQSDNAQQF
uniref:Uncharacterized protein n=1 Tax=Octopus bimaculoides TaxID=37653 RepID=A0A0L8FGI6_OCTBM